jgi:hypothetical protein
MPRKKLTMDEIDQEIISIKQEGNSQLIEDIKVKNLIQTYFFQQKELKVKYIIKNVTQNIKFIMREKNMNFSKLYEEVKRKTGQDNYMYKSNLLVSEDYYIDENILHTTLVLAFTFNVSPWDMMFHDMEYLSSKNLLSTF